jgi:hypothetical protein
MHGHLLERLHGTDFVQIDVQIGAPGSGGNNPNALSADHSSEDRSLAREAESSQKENQRQDDAPSSPAAVI